VVSRATDKSPQKVTTRVKSDRIEALVLRYLLDLATKPDRLQALREHRDRQLAALDVDADRAATKRRIAELTRSRNFLIRHAARDAEQGLLDETDHQQRLHEVDEKLAAAKAVIADLDAVETRAAKQRLNITDLIARLEQEDVDWSTVPVPETNRDEAPPWFTKSKPPSRLTRGWAFLLQTDIDRVLRPGRRGATPPLTRWAIGETKALAEALGVYVVLTENEGDGPRLVDNATGETLATAQPGSTLANQNPARWPNVEIAIDPTLGRSTPHPS
jgi:hypothetical protein